MTARHGTYTRYAGRPGCRCPRCRRAKREYVADRRAAGLEHDTRTRHDSPIAAVEQRRAERERLAERARRHVARLYAAGVAQTTIAASAGVNRRTVADLDVRVPRPETSRKIIAVAAPRQRRTA